MKKLFLALLMLATSVPLWGQAEHWITDTYTSARGVAMTRKSLLSATDKLIGTETYDAGLTNIHAACMGGVPKQVATLAAADAVIAKCPR